MVLLLVLFSLGGDNGVVYTVSLLGVPISSGVLAGLGHIRFWHAALGCLAVVVLDVVLDDTRSEDAVFFARPRGRHGRHRRARAVGHPADRPAAESGPDQQHRLTSPRRRLALESVRQRVGGSSACAMCRELAPDEDHEHRRADEREPERRGHAEPLGEQRRRCAEPTTRPPYTPTSVDAARPAPGARWAPPAGGSSSTSCPRRTRARRRRRRSAIATAGAVVSARPGA